jgi:hypothetical protein
LTLNIVQLCAWAKYERVVPYLTIKRHEAVGGCRALMRLGLDPFRIECRGEWAFALSGSITNRQRKLDSPPHPHSLPAEERVGVGAGLD